VECIYIIVIKYILYVYTHIYQVYIHTCTRRSGVGGDCVEVEAVGGGSRADGRLWSVYIYIYTYIQVYIYKYIYTHVQGGARSVAGGDGVEVEIVSGGSRADGRLRSVYIYIYIYIYQVLIHTCTRRSRVGGDCVEVEAVGGGSRADGRLRSIYIYTHIQVYIYTCARRSEKCSRWRWGRNGECE